MKLKITTLILLTCVCSAWADTITIGEIDLTGTFTTNHLYNFNNPGQAPFGFFNGPVTAQNATGIFAPYVNQGDILSMASNAVWTTGQLPLFTIGGYTLTTTLVLDTGPAGSFLFGLSDLTGHGFDPNNYPNPAGGGWSFFEPGIDPNQDLTGPITMLIEFGYSAPVPESDSTVLLLAMGVFTILLFLKRASFA
jgi:hypothetical protein